MPCVPALVPSTGVHPLTLQYTSAVYRLYRFIMNRDIVNGRSALRFRLSHDAREGSQGVSGDRHVSSFLARCQLSCSATAIMLFKTSLLFSLFVAAVQASNVLELDPSNFDEHVGKGKPALVEL